MSFRLRIFPPLLVLTLLGCSPQDAAKAATFEGAAAPAIASSGTRTEAITDPTLNNMVAFQVTVPARWQFQGTLYQGGTCTPVPSAVYRATSPEGLSYAELMPTLSWRWGTGPVLKNASQNDCLPLSGPMSAQDFLQHMAGILHLNYLGPDAVPTADNAKAQQLLQQAQASVAGKYAAAGLHPPKTTRELARAMVSTTNGTFAMKGRLDVVLDCMESVYPGTRMLGPYGGPGHPPQMIDGPSSTVEKCTAAVRYITAPANQFVALLRQWDAPGMVARPQDDWQQAWIQRNQQQANQTMAQSSRAAAAQRQASSQQFAHDQQVRQTMHEQFLSTMQRGTDMSMARTQQNMAARSTATSDWVDYALDQQTTVDPITGQLSKVSSSYRYTWLDKTGTTTYQANTLEANPNGVLPGTWVRQTVTHGDGTRTRRNRTHVHVAVLPACRA